MRSRYSAFATGQASYVMDTTHPEGSSFEANRASWERSISQFSSTTSFTDLNVLASESNGGVGRVRFRASLKQGDQDASFTEDSRFLQVDGRWLYESGELEPT